MKNTHKPNIVLLFTDDQRYNTIHALGNPDIHTPNMDRLVRMGTAFTHAHIPSGTSGAICMPSRAMLHTGRSLFHLQGEGQDIPPDHTTLGEHLRQNGYYTHGMGKWHNGPPAFNRSFDSGENIFFGGMWDHWNVPTNRYDPTGEYDNVINFTVDFYSSNEVTQMRADNVAFGVHSSELLSASAVDFINNYDRSEPFFMYTAFLAPHDPRTMPERFKQMYPAEDIKLPLNVKNEHDFDFGVSDIRDELLASYPRTDHELRTHLSEYYAMITHLDHEIGKVIDALEAKGLLDDTIIILAGDNGLAVGSHGLMGKQNHYEHSIRVPLIIAGPSIPANKQDSRYVYLFDLFPTLCELTGLDIPPSVDGKSFARMFHDESFVTRERLYFAYNDLIRSIKNDRYKLICYSNHIEHIQLFDLMYDPDELYDIFNDKMARSDDTLRARIIEIFAELSDGMAEFRDEWDELSHRYGRNYWKTEAEA